MRRFPAAAPIAPEAPLPVPVDATAQALRDLVETMRANAAKPVPVQVVLPPPPKPWNTLTVKITRDRQGNLDRLVFTKSP